MKRWFIVLGLAGLMAGCERRETKTITITSPSEEKGVEIEYSYTEKPKFVAELKRELSELDDEMIELSAKMSNATENAKAEMRPKLEALKEKAENLDVQIDKAENATEETWAEVKEGSKKALAEVKEGFRDARDWIAEKIND